MADIKIGGSPKWRKDHEGNKPGKDKREQKPDFKGKVDAVEYKKAVQGRSTFQSKVGRAKRDVYLS